jgi:hypothetical protein
MSTIITRNSATSGSVPSSLVQGELAINVTDGKLFYGSGSLNNVKEFGVTASYATQALSASYAANGGVTQLLAGPNITLSPTNGKGQVTVSATLSGSTIFNTATGSYGSFYDTTTQTNPVANIPRSMSLDSTDISNGVSVSGSTNPFNTYIKTQNAGIYNLQFSAQVDKTDGGSDEIVIWLRKNGIDLTETATTLTLPTNNSKAVAAWNWFVTSAAGDYYQIIWRSTDIDLRLLAEPISVDHPGIPSVIVTANRVDQFLSNTGSFSGSFTGAFTGSFSGSGIITSASYAATASLAPLYLPLAGGTVTGNVTVLGTASINTLVVNQTEFSSGSNQLGDAANDTQTLYGTVVIPTGNFNVTGSSIFSGSITAVGSNYLFKGAGSGDGGIQIGNTINGYTGIDWISNNVGFGLIAGGGITVKVNSGYGLNVGTAGTTSLGAMMGVKGSGTTSATTNFLTQNSSGTSLFQITDDGQVNMASSGGRIKFIGPSSGASGNGIFWGVSATGTTYGSITLSSGGGQLDYFTDTSYFHRFITLGGTEVMRIGTGYTANIGIRTASPQVGLHIATTTAISGSGSTLSVGTLASSSAVNIYKSGSTVLDIQGSQGQLFSVTDDLSNSLFSVNTIAGLPVIEAFATNDVYLGKYNTYPIKTTASGTLAVITGSFSGSVVGTLTGTASYATTASYALSTLSASYAPSTPTFPYTGSALITGSLGVTGSISAKNGNAVLAFSSDNASYAYMSSDNNFGYLSTSPIGNHIRMSVTSNTTQFLQDCNFLNGASILGSPWYGYVLNLDKGIYTTDDYLRWGTGKINSSGSFGIGKTTPINATLDVSGSAIVTGSLNVTGGITGSLLGTASYATTSLTASYVNPLTQSVLISGSLLATSNIGVQGSAIGVRLYGSNSNASPGYFQFLYNSGASTGGYLNYTYNGQMTFADTNVSLGAKLGVRGQGTTSSTTSLLVQNSNTSASLAVLDNGYVGVGTATPAYDLDVNGRGRFTNGLILAQSGYNGFINDGMYTAMGYNTGTEVNNTVLKIGFGTGTSVTTLLKLDNTTNSTSAGPTTVLLDILANPSQTANLLQWRNSGGTILGAINATGKVAIGRTSATASLDVAGNFRVSSSINTSISGSVVTVIGSGSAQPIFTVQGSQGELFSITDSLSGSLFSVNDISGLPILEVFSDSSTLIGNYQDPMLITTAKVVQTNSGSFTLYSLPTASYDTAFFEYSIRSGSNARAGTIMAIQSGSAVNFTETTTTDFGSTSAVSFTVIVTGSNMALTGSSTSGAWTIKTIVRGI